MANTYNILEEIKTKLSLVPNIKTLKIGFEKGIGSADSPFVRIVPEITVPSIDNSCLEGGGDDTSVDIIYGFDTKNKDLELLYDQFYTMEKDIREALVNTNYTSGRCVFISTLTDQDQLVNIKSAIIRFEMLGIK